MAVNLLYKFFVSPDKTFITTFTSNTTVLNSAWEFTTIPKWKSIEIPDDM